MLAYKRLWYGSRLVVANRYDPSSKMSSWCGRVLEALPLRARQWDCQGCGAHHERDATAAKNQLVLALLGG
jgi:putative transposase